MTTKNTPPRQHFPVFLRVEGRRVLVVGGGAVALEKATALFLAGADVLVVAPEVCPELDSVASVVLRRGFLDADVDGSWFVVTAATPAVNREVKRAADARRAFVIAVDDVESCSAIGAAQLTRGGLTVAISSDGRAPALVALLRRALEQVLPDDVGEWVVLAERLRASWKSTSVPLAERRPLLLRALTSMYSQGTEATP